MAYSVGWSSKAIADVDVIASYLVCWFARASIDLSSSPLFVEVHLALQ